MFSTVQNTKYNFKYVSIFQMEVFERREEIDNADGAAELSMLLSQIREDFTKVERAFSSSLQANNQDRCTMYAFRLKYYSKVRCTCI
jgi:DnaJ-domain-containing protein 1